MDASDASSARLRSEAAAEKPLPLDFSHYYSVTTQHRLPSKMKQYYKFFMIPGIGQLAGGLPNVSYFPYDTLEAQVARPERWAPTPNYPPDPDGDAAGALAGKQRAPDDNMAAAHIAVPKASAETDPIRRIDLASALQYGTAEGYPALLSWVRQFVSHLHPSVPYRGGLGVVLSCGSTDGMNKTLELFVNPWSPELHDPRDRPAILVEPFMYPMVLSQCAPRGMQIVPAAADAGGIVADALEDVLGNWDVRKGRRPHLMYTVTMGHNPTGIVLSLERKKAIYAVCSKYDVIIIEDDPYFYLQFPSAAAGEAASRNKPLRATEEVTSGTPAAAPWKSSGYSFLDSLVPSYLSVDTDGRVVRLDTFSKTIAPGCRLGWITAQPALIERYVRIAETTTQQPSGFVQSMVAELVLGPHNAAALESFRSLRGARERAAFSGWKMDGWVRWLEGLRGEYERRMARTCRILDEGRYQLKQGTPVSAADADWGVVTKTALFEYDWPRGGMFVWLRMRFEAHPLWGALDSRANAVDGTALCGALLIFLTRKPYLVLVSPGLMFSATDDIRAEDGWKYCRLCFAAVPEEELEDCSRRFVQGVQRFWKVKNVKELEDLVKELPEARNLEEDGGFGNFGTWLGC